MKKIIIVYAALILIVAALALWKIGVFDFLFNRNAEANFNGTVVELLVADSDEERQRGLSGKDSLAENQGMVFVFDEAGEYGFWMKDMKFAIDMIFLNNETVVTIHENVAPPGENPNVAELSVYKPSEPANRVIELPAGRARELGIEEGSTVELSGI